MTKMPSVPIHPIRFKPYKFLYTAVNEYQCSLETIKLAPKESIPKIPIQSFKIPRIPLQTIRSNGYPTPITLTFIKIVRLPQMIQRARPLVIKPHPRLPLTTPMQQTNRTRMQGPTTPFHIIPTEPVLVPPVMNGLNIASED
ncbi:hypothetical protein Hanom_Chr17g01548161 [Helianthus anomalus]